MSPKPLNLDPIQSDLCIYVISVPGYFRSERCLINFKVNSRELNRLSDPPKPM